VLCSFPREAEGREAKLELVDDYLGQFLQGQELIIGEVSGLAVDDIQRSEVVAIGGG
jgi:hypothetical protein